MATRKRGSKTKTEGAIKGGNGRYQFALAQVKDVPAGTGYSTSHGGVVEVSDPCVSSRASLRR